MANETYIYLYCAMNQEPVLGKAAVCTDNLRWISFNKLYAVISNVSAEDFSEESLKKNIADMAWLEKHIRIHENVINNTISLGNAPVVPFKFATVFFNEDSLKSFLSEYSDVLKRNLEFLKNKEEWGVKIYCNKIQMGKCILSNDPDIKAIDTEISSSTPGKAFFIKKKKQELLDNISHNKVSEYGKDCYSCLEKLSAQSKISKLQPKELTGKEFDMILNAVFLVESSSISGFINTLLDLKNKYSARGLDIEYSGPWPAYNFCSIEKKV